MTVDWSAGVTLGQMELAQPPQSLTFQCGDTWALEITKDGIISNPDVPTDEGAKAIFAALEPYIRDLRPPR